VVGTDIIMNLYKRSRVQVVHHAIPDMDEAVLGILRHHLETLPARIQLDPTRYADALRTTDSLYNVVLQELMARKLSNRGVTLPYIDELCQVAFKRVEGKWYLPSEEIRADRLNLDVEDEPSAIEWIRSQIEARPMTLAELIPPWMDFPMGESLLLLTLTDFLERQGVQNVALSLSGLGLFSQAVHDLLPLLPEVRAFLKAQPKRWQRIIQRADRGCAQDQAEQAISLLKGMIPAARWISLIDAEMPPTLAMALLLGYLDDQMGQEAGPSLKMPEWVPDWAETWLNGWEVPHYDAPAEARAATLLRMVWRIITIQRCLAAPLPQPDDIGALVDAYVESGDARIELLLAFSQGCRRHWR
jgi:hypothetical protein